MNGLANNYMQCTSDATMQRFGSSSVEEPPPSVGFFFGLKRCLTRPTLKTALHVFIGRYTGVPIWLNCSTEKAIHAPSLRPDCPS